MTKEVKAAWIGGICTIIASIFSINVNIENNDLLEENKWLKTENANLKEINNDLQSKIDDLIKENELLKNRKSTGIDDPNDSKPINNPENNSISIFDLETFNLNYSCRHA